MGQKANDCWTAIIEKILVSQLINNGILQTLYKQPSICPDFSKIHVLLQCVILYTKQKNNRCQSCISYCIFRANLAAGMIRFCTNASSRFQNLLIRSIINITGFFTSSIPAKTHSRILFQKYFISRENHHLRFSRLLTITSVHAVTLGF